MLCRSIQVVALVPWTRNPNYGRHMRYAYGEDPRTPLYEPGVRELYQEQAAQNVKIKSNKCYERRKLTLGYEKKSQNDFIDGNRHFLTEIDEYSWNTTVFRLCSKREAADVMLSFIRLFKMQSGHFVRSVRIDGGGCCHTSTKPG